MTLETDRSIAELARTQHGLITRSQLGQLGVATSTIRRRQSAGLLIPHGRRTWRLAGAPPTERTAIAAACLDLRGTASHWTAAWLHRLVRHRWPVIDITVGRRRSVWSPADDEAVRVHTSTNLPPDDVLTIDGLPTTSVARTLMALGAVVPTEVSASGLDELVSTAIEQGVATERWLWWTLAERRCRGRNGVVAFEEALARRARLGPTESWLEREVLRILATDGLPLPRIQRVIRRRGRFAARVDFAYGDYLVIEALGYAFHRSRADLERDTRRANEIQLLGRRVLQFTFDQVTRDPRSVSRTVRSALAETGHALAA